ncbi:MAG: hypothetical protein AAFU33_28140 [Bacteroidota bacterium]
MKKVIVFIFTFTVVSAFFSLHGQPSISAPSPEKGTSSPTQTEVQVGNNTMRPPLANIKEGGWLSERESGLSFLILSFGIVLILLIILAKKIGGIEISSDQFLRLVSIILIIISSLVIISSGFNDKQISSVVGLLGTLAGYLLGRRDSSQK